MADVTLGSSMVVTSNYCTRATGTGARIFASGNTLNNCVFGLYASSGGVLESASNNMVRSCGTCALGVTPVGTQ